MRDPLEALPHPFLTWRWAIVYCAVFTVGTLLTGWLLIPLVMLWVTWGAATNYCQWVEAQKRLIKIIASPPEETE